MSLAQLPDELLINVFGRLSTAERHRALPLVSRRCRQLVCSPQLLHTVNVQISGDTDEQALSRLRSLAQFLLQHGGGSVRQLRLNLGRCGRQQDDQIESMALMAAAATACSGLEELVLEALFIMPLSSWLLPLRSSLRRLEVRSGVGAVVTGPLAMMTALQELEFGLYGDYVDVEADGCLPTSLTSLTLGSGDAFKRVPSKIGTLCNLRHLTIWHPCHGVGSNAALTQLSLHTLELLGCVRSVPDCLSALTTLQSLAVDGCSLKEHEAAVAAGLSVALHQLVQLTRLELAVWSSGPLASLTALTNLRRLCWWEEPEGDGAALPHGHWLQQLQTFAAPVSLVVHSLPALEGARSLQQLYPETHGDADAALRSIIRWAAQHPSLQQLLMGESALSKEVWPETLYAARLRLSLQILANEIDHHHFL